MQRTRTAIAKTILKTTALCQLIAAGSLLFVSYKTEKMYADLWAQLGIAKNEGSTQIRESFMFGYLQFYGARNIRKIASADRVAVAKDLLAYTKQYVQSESFKKEYANQRNDSKPIAPGPEITQDVDFGAALKEKYGKKVFVNPAYERKHANWKYAFRAGREVTETVRTFAENWLKEIK